MPAMLEFAGEFETHLTVDLAGRDGEGDLAALRAWGAARGMKCTHIVLARGQSVSQPMLTRQGRGGLTGELVRAEALAAELATAGFAVTRIKIEASPFNQDVPQTDHAGAIDPPERYFEHHVKLLLERTSDVPDVTALAQHHAAHVSRNALRVRDDRREERFVTQRCHRVGRETAERQLAALLRALRDGGYQILESESEFVVYDQNLALDDGWIGEQ
jgi:hypothetical protein